MQNGFDGNCNGDGNERNNYLLNITPHHQSIMELKAMRANKVTKLLGSIKGNIRVIMLLVSLSFIIVSGCISATPGPMTGHKNPQTQLSDIVGSWRIYSSRLFYDAGGAGVLGTTATQVLELKADSSYSFGSSSGTWSVESISSDDWTRWGIKPYGPTMKIILSGWNGGSADGPIEESTGVDFIWVIYKVGPPIVSASGTVQMKFGHANLNEKPATSPGPETSSLLKAVAGTYKCVGCDTRSPLVLKEDGSWVWADTTGTFTVEGSKVVFKSPFAGGSGWASQGGAADWGPAEIENGTITFNQSATEHWVRST